MGIVAMMEAEIVAVTAVGTATVAAEAVVEIESALADHNECCAVLRSAQLERATSHLHGHPDPRPEKGFLDVVSSRQRVERKITIAGDWSPEYRRFDL
jgi:hypothetical protein